MLVISPYVSGGLLNEFAKGGAATELISRGDQLELLNPATLGPLEDVWVLDDAAEPEPGDVDQTDTDLPEGEPPQDETTADAQSPRDDVPLVGLHAKVYVIDEGRFLHPVPLSCFAEKHSRILHSRISKSSTVFREVGAVAVV